MYLTIFFFGYILQVAHKGMFFRAGKDKENRTKTLPATAVAQGQEQKTPPRARQKTQNLPERPSFGRIKILYNSIVYIYNTVIHI